MDLSFLQSQYLKRRQSSAFSSVSHDYIAAYERIRTLLSLPPSERTSIQISSLAAMLRSLRFFAELDEKSGEFPLLQCSRRMAFLSIAAGQCVFREGDSADRFFVILSGSCAVVAAGTEGKAELLAVLRAGESFGELALLGEGRRLATVFCRETCTFAVMDKEEYMEVLKPVHERELREKNAFLQRHPAFSSWSPLALRQLSAAFHLKLYTRRQSLFSVNLPACDIFLIHSGSFYLTKSLCPVFPPSGIYRGVKKKYEGFLLNPGEIVGVSAVLQATPYQFTCYCASEYGNAFVIDGKNFKRIRLTEDWTKKLLGMDGCRSRLGLKQTETEEKKRKSTHMSRSKVVRRDKELTFQRSSWVSKEKKVVHKRISSLSKEGTRDLQLMRLTTMAFDRSWMDAEEGKTKSAKKLTGNFPKIGEKAEKRNKRIPRNASLPNIFVASEGKRL